MEAKYYQYDETRALEQLEPEFQRLAYATCDAGCPGTASLSLADPNGDRIEGHLRLKKNHSNTLTLSRVMEEEHEKTGAGVIESRQVLA